MLPIILPSIKNSTMSHWKKSLLTFLFKLEYFLCKQWDLLNENSTMSHWKYIPFSIYSIYRILPCKQWDLLNCKNSTMSHWPILITVYKYLFYFHMCKQWDLLKLPFNYVPLAHSTSLHTNILHLQDM